MKRFLLPALLSALMIAEVHAESFTVSDIRVNGLQRVSAGSVFAALPLNVGETIDDQALVQATRSLFKTGFFQDLTPGCFLKGLSKFLFSTWKTPFSLAGMFSSTDKQHLIFMEKNHADSNDGTVRVFAIPFQIATAVFEGLRKDTISKKA